MRVLILLLCLKLSVYAKDKNIFLDVDFTFPLSGKAQVTSVNSQNSNSNNIDLIWLSYDEQNSYTNPFLFLGVSLGYVVNISDQFALEPSGGYNFNAPNDLFLTKNDDLIYNYYHAQLAGMYHKKDFKGGLYIKRIYIPSIDIQNYDKNTNTIFKNQQAYGVGAKIVLKSWFVFYEYITDAKYVSDDQRKSVNLNGHRIGIGLRKSF